MGFWHLIFGIFGGGDGAVSVNAIDSDNVTIINFSADAEVLDFEEDAEIVAMSAAAEIVDFTR